MTEERIIAVETSGRKGSVALAAGPHVVATRTFATNVEHARELLPSVDSLVREQGWTPQSLTQCHISIGPGSFTGLRVAVTFARMLAAASNVRICAVPTLDVIAENCATIDAPPRRVVVILDAKRMQVYGAVYEHRDGTYCRVAEPAMIAPSELLAPFPRPTAVIGEGIAHHLAEIGAAEADVLDESLWWPQAVSVHRLGWRMAEQQQFVSARDLVPNYIRRPEAEELWEKRHGRDA